MSVAAEEITLADQLAEVERELKARVFLYPRMVKDGKLTQNMADTRLRRMEAVARTLRQMTQRGGLLL